MIVYNHPNLGPIDMDTMYVEYAESLYRGGYAMEQIVEEMSLAGVHPVQIIGLKNWLEFHITPILDHLNHHSY